MKVQNYEKVIILKDIESIEKLEAGEIKISTINEFYEIISGKNDEWFDIVKIEALKKACQN